MKRPAFSFVRAALLRQWKLRGNVKILQLLQGGFAFRFSDVRDRDDILDGEAFYIGGQPMFIRKWERSLHSGGILGLKTVPLWITLPGLPLHLWGEDALSAISSVLGNPLYADRTTATKSRLAFARVCVEFSGDKPLLEQVSIEDDMGLLYTQKVSYEWKPPQCLKCGVFGHTGCGMDEEVRVLPAQISGKEMRPPSDIFKEVSANDKVVEKSDDGREVSDKENHTAEDESMEDEGWEFVRARKKRPVGPGAPFPVHTRQDKIRNKGEGVVARSYWAKRNNSFEKVPISKPSLNMEISSNSQICGEKEGCPLSSNIVLNDSERPHGQKYDLVNSEMTPLAAQKIQNGSGPNGENFLNVGEGLEKVSMTITPIDALTTEKHPSVSTTHWCNLDMLNDKLPKLDSTPNEEKNLNFEGGAMIEHGTTTLISHESQSEPCNEIEETLKDSSSMVGKSWAKNAQQKPAACSRSSKPVLSFGSRPVTLGSTAGHTPYKRRLATMARELRHRQHGQSSKKDISGDIPSSEDAIYNSHTQPRHSGPIGAYRPNPQRLLQTKSPANTDPCVRTLSMENYGEEDDLLGDGLETTEKGEPQLHMEMPKYLMTRKELMDQHHLKHISAKEKPMLEMEDQGSEMSSATATQGREARCDLMGHGQAHSPT